MEGLDNVATTIWGLTITDTGCLQIQNTDLDLLQGYTSPLMLYIN